MERQQIKEFQLPVEDGIGILVTFMLMFYEEQACPECKRLHTIDFKEQLGILKSYPGSEEERHFLYFMLGSMNQHSHLWDIYGIAMSILKPETTEEKLKVTEEFIMQCIFNDDETPIHPKINPHATKLN
jgi:hypothetical protein